MMRRTSLLAVAVLLGCGGTPEAREATSPLTIEPVSERAGESLMARPRAIPGEEAALEACLAPIDPAVFSKRGVVLAPKKRENLAPRRQPRLEPADPCADQPSSVECAYREARIHFEERRFDLAARGFRKIALDTEVSELGLFAGQLALESLNMLGTQAEPPRAACLNLLASDNEKLIERYCRGPELTKWPEACGPFWRIAHDIRRLRAETLVKAADAGPPNDSTQLYERAGDEYRSLFDDACAPEKNRKGLGGDPPCDEILFNAHRAYRAALARDKMEAAYRTFFDPRFGLEKSRLAEQLRPSSASPP